jgi:hypothetical protein
MWAVSIPQKSFWDRLWGESLCERVGTLGGDGLSILGVTTVEVNCAFVMSCVRIVVCDLFCHGRGMG